MHVVNEFSKFPKINFRGFYATPIIIDFDTLIEYCEEYPPYQLASFHLINWVEELNNGNLNMSTFDLVDMFKIFMKNEPLDVDFNTSQEEVYLKNQLNQASQLLKTKKYKKITEAEMHKIDNSFITLQINSFSY